WEGADQTAQVFFDRQQLRNIVSAVRQDLRPADTTFEILLDGVDSTPPQQQAQAPDKEAPASEPDPNAPPDPSEDKTAKAPAPKPRAAGKNIKPEKNPEPENPKAPEPEKPKAEIAKIEPAQPMAPPPPPPADHRIAVRQNVDKNQEDNPS